MKAIVCERYGEAEVLAIREMGKPDAGADDVIVQVHAASVTASDCMIRSLRVSPEYRFAMRLAIGWNKPRNPVLGMVYAGIVESAGKNVRSLQAGDAVVGFDRFGFGAYAEYKRASADGVLARIPANIGFEEAAAIPYGGMLALHFLKKANARKGQRVLVYGASGAVGTAAVQLARLIGADVTGICSAANLELIRSLGASRAINYMREDFTREPIRYDLIFNAAGKSKARLNRRNSLSARGRHITVDDGSPKLLRADLEYLLELAGKGEFKPVIDRVYPMDRIAEAHRYVEQGHKKGNVIVTMTEMKKA